MLLYELRSRCYIHLKDYAKERFDPLMVDTLLNESLEEFNAATGLLRVRTQITITNGYGDLVDTTEGAGFGTTFIQGDILRVEDSGNNNQKLSRTTEEKMDILKKPTWRLDVVGPMQFWMRGKANEGSQTGYETIVVYPLVATGTINLFHVKKPIKLFADTESPEIPSHYHMALVWHTITCLLMGSQTPEDKEMFQYAQQRYGEFLARAVAEVSKELR